MGKKIVFLIIVLVFLSSLFSQEIKITDKVKIIILPGKTVQAQWTLSQVEYLLTILEEQALNLGRFEIYPRTDLEQLIKERNLSEFGITEVQKLSAIGGYKYAILLTLTDLSASQSLFGAYEVVSRCTLKLYNIETGQLLASKAIESIAKSMESPQSAYSEAIKDTANKIFLELRKWFRIEAYVKQIDGNNIILSGVSPDIVKVGYNFSVSSSKGTSILQVVQIKQNQVVTQLISGPKPEIDSIAVEESGQQIQQDAKTSFSPTAGKTFKVGLGLASIESVYGIIYGFGMFGTFKLGTLPVNLYFSSSLFLGVNYKTLSISNSGIGYKIFDIGFFDMSINAGVSYISYTRLYDSVESIDFFAGADLALNFGMFGIYVASEALLLSGNIVIVQSGIYMSF